MCTHIDGNGGKKMASVNFEKLKTPQEVKAMLRHCDKDERLEHNHTNKQIDKSKIHKNAQIIGYADACQAYDARIKYLDSLPGANIRKDRVTCFGLNIPFPEGLKETDDVKWTNKVLKLVEQQYGAKNIIAAYLHEDEVHDYKDAETGKQRTSRPHVHVYVVPEVDGKLNGKVFSSKSNMQKLNRNIHKMTQIDYNVDFMDGSKRKSKKEVETLKELSRLQELNQKEKSVAEQATQNQDIQARLHEQMIQFQEEKRQFQEEKQKFDKEKAKFQEREDALEAQKSILRSNMDECKVIYEKLSERAKKDIKSDYNKLLDMRKSMDEDEKHKTTKRNRQEQGMQKVTIDEIMNFLV